jgi:nucleoside-diphosphate-sugar epimerase
LGGAGFIGSALVDLLTRRGEGVIVVDDLSTGKLANIGEALACGRATLVFGNSTENGEAVYSALRDPAGPPPDVLYRLHDAPAPLDLIRTLGIPALTLAVPEDGRELRIFGPRMPADPGNILWQMCAAAAIGQPVSFEGSASHPIDLAFVGNVALDLDAAGLGRSGAGAASVVVAASDAMTTVGEFGGMLAEAARFHRSRPARRSRFGSGGPDRSPDRYSLDEALLETLRWFASAELPAIAGRA